MKLDNKAGLVQVPCASLSKKRTNTSLTGAYSHPYETPGPSHLCADMGTSLNGHEHGSVFKCADPTSSRSVMNILLY